MVSELKIDKFLTGYVDENLLLSPELAGWVRKHINHIKDEELEENQTIINYPEAEPRGISGQTTLVSQNEVDGNQEYLGF
jgi:hypothetical protein